MRPFVRGLLLVALATSSCGSDAAPVAAQTPDGVAPTSIAARPSAPPTTNPTVTSEAPTSTPGPSRLTVSYGPESEQFGLLHLPQGEAPDNGFPVVVLVHGGFWRQGFDFSLMTGLASDLVSRGYAVWNIEYRRVGGSGGWPQTGTDVAAAIAHLAELTPANPLDLNRVVSVGHSAGGHLGLWALGNETTVQVRGSVGLGAVVDLAAFRESQGLLGGTIDEVPEAYADAAPTLDPERAALIQGAADGIVPTASLDVAIAAGVPVTVIDGEDHFDLIDPTSESWAATLVQIEAWISHSS